MRNHHIKLQTDTQAGQQTESPVCVLVSDVINMCTKTTFQCLSLTLTHIQYSIRQVKKAGHENIVPHFNCLRNHSRDDDLIKK